ncbi:M28 family peptidase [Parabacteroides sp. PF5-6]|uniref:M28 family peptidase n=1 Tax=Parabacteroides sp. PF5-6 TaxID=1742403 RepID=UPI0024069E06|nr:M28 family peptidase [Parabacteroides sp. PF5-6]
MTILSVILAFCLLSCGGKGNKEEAKSTTPAQPVISSTATPEFNADSAYHFVARQVDFGPRVPNTTAHKACGDYLIAELTRFGAQLYVQETTLTAYNGDRLESRNIIGAYNPENPKRILLFAHWDTRPYADQETDATKHHTPIDGADDGASGVGALLEIARQINQNDPGIGIDIIFFDAEDYGEPAFARTAKPDTWCLGSQFWAKNPHVKNYRAEYGILLDMVGHKEATFYKEGYSMQYAAPMVEKIWNKAREMGYGRFFIQATGGSYVDDHIYVKQGRNIPCVDIIYTSTESRNGFGDHWHTLNDTMDNIEPATLKAAGQTVLEMIYNR